MADRSLAVTDECLRLALDIQPGLHAESVLVRK